MLTALRKDHSAKILHPSPETVKVFKMSDKKFYNWTGQTTYFAVLAAQIQFQSALKQLHLNIKETISSCDLSLVNPGPILAYHWPLKLQVVSSLVTFQIAYSANLKVGMAQGLQSQTFFSIELRARCEM